MHFVATNIDNVYSTGSRLMPGGGSSMITLASASGRTPFICGKPSKILFDQLINKHGLENEPLSKFLMIGDKIDTDIVFGHNSGIDTLLVFSGVTSKDKLSAHLASTTPVIPTYTLDSVKDLLN